MSFFAKIAAVSKPIVGFLGVVLAGLNEVIGFVPDPYKHYVTGVIALLTFIVSYYAKYAPLGNSGPSAGQPGGYAAP